MRLDDEVDYAKLERQDLVARLMSAQAMARFLLKGYHALRSYGVDFMKLPEWQNQTPLDEAARLRPHAAQPKIIEYFVRLDHALRAVIRRKQFRTVGTHEPSDDR